MSRPRKYHGRPPTPGIRRQYKRAAWTALPILAAANLIGCKTTNRTDETLLVFPAPPAEPRIQFLTWASGAQQVEGPVSDLVKLALGGEPVNRPRMDKPYGVAARDGVVYICDTKLPGLCRLNFKDKKYDLIGIRGPGRLRKPIHLTIDPLGYKFIADSVRRQIVVFSPDDEYVTAFNVPEPCRPVDVALWENELYVLDNDDTCQIVVLNRETGEVLRTFGGPGQDPGQFRTPNSISFDSDGYLYVSDLLNFRIQKLTREGEPVWTQGQSGYLLGQFGRPRGLRVGPDGIIYVVDCATEIIQMYNSEGEILMHFGGPGTIPGSVVLPAAVAPDATSIPYFRKYIHDKFDVEYLLFVTSQYGDHLLSVYAFGSFPEGYQPEGARIETLTPTGVQNDEGSTESLPRADDTSRRSGDRPAQNR